MANSLFYKWLTIFHGTLVLGLWRLSREQLANINDKLVYWKPSTILPRKNTSFSGWDCWSTSFLKSSWALIAFTLAELERSWDKPLLISAGVCYSLYSIVSCVSFSFCLSFLCWDEYSACSLASRSLVCFSCICYLRCWYSRLTSGATVRDKQLEQLVDFIWRFHIEPICSIVVGE